MMERKRNHYKYNDSAVEPVTSNYYPVTSKIVIKDESKDLQLAILNDRSQGGSSLWGGEIELMVSVTFNQYIKQALDFIP